MTNLDINNILYCRLDGLTGVAREQRRAKTLAQLGLLVPQGALAILEEATRNSSDFLDVPIALLSIFVDNQQLIKSVVGLSHLGFNQEVVVNRQISPAESFCIHVVDSLTAFAIEDTFEDPFFRQSLLTQHCGIRSYLGVPLITDTGECIGTLAVMDLYPRHFTTKDLQFLAVLARLTITQLENHRHKVDSNLIPQLPPDIPDLSNINNVSNVSEVLQAPVKLQLLAKLIEELRTPLTSVMGMTGILQQQIYGRLTAKQQEYLEVIRQSGQRMLGRIEEIITLDVDNSSPQQLNLVNVDMEMLGQQIINNLQGVIQDRQQQVHLSIQEGSRIWLVDRRAVQQMLYYLVSVMLDVLPLGSQIKILIDRQHDYQSIQVMSDQGVANLPSLKRWRADFPLRQLSQILEEQTVPASVRSDVAVAGEINSFKVATPNLNTEYAQIVGAESWHRLGLLWSYQLAEIHGGKMLRQDSEEFGYGYVVILPQLKVS